MQPHIAQTIAELRQQSAAFENAAQTLERLCGPPPGSAAVPAAVPTLGCTPPKTLVEVGHDSVFLGKKGIVQLDAKPDKPKGRTSGRHKPGGVSEQVRDMARTLPPVFTLAQMQRSLSQHSPNLIGGTMRRLKKQGELMQLPDGTWRLSGSKPAPAAPRQIANPEPEPGELDLHATCAKLSQPFTVDDVLKELASQGHTPDRLEIVGALSYAAKQGKLMVMEKGKPGHPSKYAVAQMP
jgi:hypothetical protein